MATLEELACTCDFSLTLCKMTFLNIKAKSAVCLSRGSLLLESMCPYPWRGERSLQSEVRSYCWRRTTDPVSQHSPGSLIEAKVIGLTSLSKCFMNLVNWGWGNWCSSGPKFTLCHFQNQILPHNKLNCNAAVAHCKESQRTRSIQQTQTDGIPRKGTKITTKKKKRYKFVLL